MPTKIETVYYCDPCKKRLNDEDIIIHCRENSSFMVTKTDGQIVEYKNGVVCKDCVAKLVGFDSWSELKSGISYVKSEYDRRFERGGPFDR